MQNKAPVPIPTTNMMGKRIPIILAGVVAGAISLYVLASLKYYRIGFPLDDAWIHQTYARSLAQAGRWEFFPGQPSAGGSTSPLWSFLLAIGHLLGVNPYVWTFLLGAICLWGTASLAEWTVRRRIKLYRPKFPWVGILFACEWHLVWAAVSGMETSLHIFLMTLFFACLLNPKQNKVILGLIVGLSVWVRPDGMTLLIPLFLAIILSKLPLKDRGTDILKAGLGFTLLVGFYLLFNLVLVGTPMPNTYYAKQTEYAALQQLPLYLRYYQQILQPLTGVGIMLLPAAIFYGYSAIKKHDWAIISSYLWLILFPGLYAFSLPVTYQHGRYGMPAIPVFMLLSSLAGADFLSQAARPKIRPFQIVWVLSASLLCVAFFIIGAWTYARDVAIIESEMVNTAQWVAENVPGDELIAAHDIGALGYFGSHQLIDLAGLISPEIIPFMRDQGQLAAFLNNKHVRYLVAFPNWYPDLISGKTQVFTSASVFSRAYGSENMAVYRWK
ncbi:MAG: hypothetical protein NTW32_10785 [Chloroflexi bacterium]|nr:hypothetical protein [Chloroflexota bacterium]